MYLLRDPRGVNARTRYNQTWQVNDEKWTNNLRSQIPVENGPNGIFYVDEKDLMRCFSGLNVATYKAD
jgi:hypothetical protein